MSNRPVVNIDIHIGNAKDNAVASFSNGFAIGTSGKSVLIVSCINCGALRLSLGGGAALKMVSLKRSARALRRIMIIKCNMRGGMSDINSVTATGKSSLLGVNDIGSISRTLRNRVPNIITVGSASGPKTSGTSLLVHNGSA